MRTYSGRQFWPLCPHVEDVALEDIVHHLAGITRFGGAAPFRYSVADHSRLVSHLAPPELKLAALVHDFAEAYVGDQIRPLKRYMRFQPHATPFAVAEYEIQMRIHAALHIPWNPMDIIHPYDDLALAIEARAFGWDTSDWAPLPEPTADQHIMYIGDLDACKAALWRECDRLGIIAASESPRSNATMTHSGVNV